MTFQHTKDFLMTDLKKQHSPSFLGLFLFFLLSMVPETGITAEREFNMTIEQKTIRVAPDLTYKVFAFNGQVPGPLIHVQEGDDVIVHVKNMTFMPHTIHWHGIYQRNNWQNDGVPGVTQKGIAPMGSFTYRWKAEKTGTLWYHCHVNVPEHVGIRGMWGPIIVDPKEPTKLETEVTKDVIMMLSTWDSDFAGIIGQGGAPRDLPDYFSLNAKSFPLTQPVRVKKGDVLRVRFIGAGSGIHSIHSHGHDMLVTHRDGTALPQPYYVDTLMFGSGERYDVIMKMDNPGLFIFHDHIDSHVSNAGISPGGPLTIIEYDSIERPPFYVWKNKDYDPNFFYSESMKHGYGMFTHDRFKGK